ncbi:hypothetical protein B0H13DRAFT_2301050 [Mycena leptocephala]|nr:hypothetical protein B0H13DRAFT_2301050 [Mycena leptocephala]
MVPVTQLPLAVNFAFPGSSLGNFGLLGRTDSPFDDKHARCLSWFRDGVVAAWHLVCSTGGIASGDRAAPYVPRAVKLLSLVTEMRHLDSSEFTPSEWKTHRALCLLGEMFDPLLEPFINPTLSLSDQITHLVKFAHLACAIFLKHETDFVSNQLYGDVQCMVKNAIPYNYDQIDTGCDA